jgi:hypothetical protein
VVTAEGRIVNAASFADSLDDAVVVDECLCVAASAALMRAAFEASYLLGYEPPPSWSAARYALALPRTVTANGVVIAQSLGPSSLPPEVPLAVLSEPLGSLVESELSVNIGSSILVNQATWDAAAAVADAAGTTWGGEGTQAIRALIRLQALAKAMQVSAALSAGFLSRLEEFLDAHCDYGPIGRGFGGLVPSGPGAAPNDLGMSARFLLVFLYGLGGAAVCGGVGESGSVYASFGVNLGASAVLPQAWDQLHVHGLGPSKIDAILLNRSLYHSGGGAVGGSGSLVYWSTDSLIL